MQAGLSWSAACLDIFISQCQGLCSQLEVLRASEGAGEYGSLLWLLDHSKTAFGGRRLRHWVAHPLTHLPSILDRQDAVEELILSGSAATAGGFGEQVSQAS